MNQKFGQLYSNQILWLIQLNFDWTNWIFFRVYENHLRKILFEISRKSYRKLYLIQSRLVYCKTREAPTTAIIGKVGFQSKKWIGCHPNNSDAYTAKVGVRRTLGPCNRRVSHLAIWTCLLERASSASRMTHLSCAPLTASKSWSWGSMIVCGGQSVGWIADAWKCPLKRPRLCW